jgi:exosortase
MAIVSSSETTISSSRYESPGASRGLFFGAWIACSIGLFWKPLAAVIAYAAHNDDASHIFLVPFISVGVLLFDRETVFRKVSFDPIAGGCLFLPAVVVALVELRHSAAPGTNHPLALTMLALVLCWLAGFAFLFGRATCLAARFPLLFLLFAIPLPDFLLSRAVYWLQAGSASVVSVLFDAVGIPYLREGFVFHLARVNIEIAQECSGIRSSMAVLILALLAAHFYIRTFWKQTVFVICSLFVMIVKNGVRIATLTLLAIYVDPSFLFGRLHRDGGVVFFLFGLALLLPILWFVAREKRNGQKMANQKGPKSPTEGSERAEIPGD